MGPETGSEIEPFVTPDIEIVARRELAVRTIDALADVLGVEVSVPNLLILAQDENPTVRIAAKRALRCIEAFGRPDSEVAQNVGETGLYHYVEGVMEFGAGERKFLELMDMHDLDPEEVTGLYAVRERVADETDGHRSGFPTLLAALAKVGIGPREAASDPEEAVAALDDAGYLVDHLGGRIFNQPILAPELAWQVSLRPHIDTPRNSEPLDWVRIQFEDPRKAIDFEEE